MRTAHKTGESSSCMTWTRGEHTAGYCKGLKLCGQHPPIARLMLTSSSMVLFAHDSWHEPMCRVLRTRNMRFCCAATYSVASKISDRCHLVALSGCPGNH